MTYTDYTITSSGGTLTTQLGNNYMISSASVVTLAASFSIVTTGNILPYSSVSFRWNASVNLNTYSITIAGITLVQDQVNQPGTFELVYDGTNYYLQYFPDFTSKPQENYGVTTITVPNAGGTLIINPGSDKKTYLLQGTTTLTSNYTVAGTTSGVTDGSAIRVVLGGGVTIGANTVTIFGQSISSYDCLIGGAEVYAEFNTATSTYVATYVNRNIPLAKLLTTGLGSGDNGKLVSYNFATNSFVASFLTAANLPSTFKGINITTTTIASGQLLTSNTTPITLIPASGSVSVVEVPLLFVVRYVYGSTTFAANLDGVFKYSAPGISNKYAGKTGMLGFTSSGIDVVYPTNYNSSVERLLAANYPLVYETNVGNPTTGNSSIVIYTISTTLNL
jgi:hypothetical protein